MGNEYSMCEKKDYESYRMIHSNLYACFQLLQQLFFSGGDGETEMWRETGWQCQTSVAIRIG